MFDQRRMLEEVLRQHPAIQDIFLRVCEDAGHQKQLQAYIVPEKDYLPAAFGRQLYRLANGLTCFHLNKNETEHVYRQIFSERLYLKYGICLRDGDCVFDVGANIGMFTLFVHQMCKDPLVFAFEPNPYAFAKLKLNACFYGFELYPFNYGLAETNKMAFFTIYPLVSVMSSFYAQIKEDREIFKRFMLNNENSSEKDRALLAAYADTLLEERFKCQSLNVPVRTLSSVIQQYQLRQIDLVKMDVEKSELAVLEGIEEQDWPKIKQMVIEVHDINGRLKCIVDMLKMRDFQVVVDQNAMFGSTNISCIYAIRDQGKWEEEADQGRSSILPPSPALSRKNLLSYLHEKWPGELPPITFFLRDVLPRTLSGDIDLNALLNR